MSDPYGYNGMTMPLTDKKENGTSCSDFNIVKIRTAKDCNSSTLIQELKRQIIQELKIELKREILQELRKESLE